MARLSGPRCSGWDPLGFSWPPNNSQATASEMLTAEGASRRGRQMHSESLSLARVPEAAGGSTHYGSAKGLQLRPNCQLGRIQREEEKLKRRRGCVGLTVKADAAQVAVRAGEECGALVLFLAWTMSYKGGSRLCRLPCSTEGYLWRSDAQTLRLLQFPVSEQITVGVLPSGKACPAMGSIAPSLSRQLSEAQAGVLG
jgi:hypothetical protein